MTVDRYRAEENVDFLSRANKYLLSIKGETELSFDSSELDRGDIAGYEYITCKNARTFEIPEIDRRAQTLSIAARGCLSDRGSFF